MYILIPDFKGTITQQRGNQNGILSRIIATYPEAIIIPVLNGGNTAELEAIATEVSKYDRVHPVVSKDTGRGLVGALLTGYEAILIQEPDAIVVRLDAEEHDISYIRVLVDLVTKNDGMAIGELSFTTTQLIPGSYDQWNHTNVFPTIYESMTNGKLRLSCAHGFQAYAPGKMLACLAVAKKIVEKIEATTGKPLAWGLDAAMAIGAIVSMTPLERTVVPAENGRDRSKEKIDAQLKAHLALLRAAISLGFV